MKNWILCRSTQTEIQVISKIHPTLQQARLLTHEFLRNDMIKNALNISSNFVTATMKISIFIIIIFFHPRLAAFLYGQKYRLVTEILGFRLG